MKRILWFKGWGLSIAELLAALTGYFIIGVGVCVFLGPATGLVEAVTMADALGMILLWPLFLIKYLAIGVWLVLESGFTLLV